MNFLKPIPAMLLGLSLVSAPASATVLTFYSAGKIAANNSWDGFNLFNLGTPYLTGQTFSMTMSFEFDETTCYPRECSIGPWYYNYQGAAPYAISVTVGGHTFTDYVTTRNDSRAAIDNKRYSMGLGPTYDSVGLSVKGYDAAGYQIQASQGISDYLGFLGTTRTLADLNVDRLMIMSQGVRYPETKFAITDGHNGTYFDVTSSQYMIINAKPSVHEPEPTPAKIPEPDSVLLLSAGLLGMLGLGRRSIAKRRGK